MPETGKFIKNRELFLTVQEAGNSKVKRPTSGEGLLAVSSYGEKSEGKRVRH
jgi:hypothetical protein